MKILYPAILRLLLRKVLDLVSLPLLFSGKKNCGFGSCDDPSLIFSSPSRPLHQHLPATIVATSPDEPILQLLGDMKTHVCFFPNDQLENSPWKLPWFLLKKPLFPNQLLLWNLSPDNSWILGLFFFMFFLWFTYDCHLWFFYDFSPPQKNHKKNHKKIIKKSYLWEFPWEYNANDECYDFFYDFKEIPWNS